MTPYPATLPFDDVTTLINDLRAGKAASDGANFAKALWELAGYALRSTLGEPTGAPQALPSPSTGPLADHEVADHLEKLVADPAAGAALPWQAILKWVLTTLASLL